MAAKPTRLIHRIPIQLHLLAESCNICSSHSRQPVRKLLDTLSYVHIFAIDTAPNKHFTVGKRKKERMKGDSIKVSQKHVSYLIYVKQL